MKRLHALVPLLLIAFLSSGWVIKESKQDEDMDLYVNDGGVVTKALSLDGATSTVQVQDGTSALPSLTFQSDPDTGTFRAAANTWGVAAGGVPVLQVDSGAQMPLSRGAGAPAMVVRRANTSLASPSVVASGDSVGGYFYQGYDGNSYENLGSISMEVDGTPGDGDMPGRMIFKTTPDGSVSPVEAMRISNNAKVSIDSNQLSPLIVARDTNAGDSTNIVEMRIGNSGTDQGQFAIQWTNAAPSGGPEVALSFQPRNNANSASINPGNLIFSKSVGADTGYVRFTGTTGAVGGNIPHECVRRSNSTTAASTTVTCSAGERLMGGGCNGSNALLATYPSSDTVWTCQQTSSAAIVAYGLCCRY